jgi:hypothetical protein
MQNRACLATSLTAALLAAFLSILQFLLCLPIFLHSQFG